MTAVALPVPGSKSLTHRAFLLAATADRPCTIESPLLADDTRSTLACLRALGADWESTEAGELRFRPAELHAAGQTLDCGNSGSTLRLLTGLAATLEGPLTLTGDDSLRRRPNGPLLRALRSLGAEVTADRGRAPLRIHGPIAAGEPTMPAGISSQFLSSVLLALTRVPGRSSLRARRPVASLPYVRLTVEVARRFGLSIRTEPASPDHQRGDLLWHIAGPAVPRLAGDRYRVQADWSTAAFPLVAAAIAGIDLTLHGPDPQSPQGDRAIVELLRAFGQEVACGGSDPTLTLRPRPRRSPGRIDLSRTPDLFPVLCALAAVSPGTTRLEGAPGLRDKECDRIAAMAGGLGALGVRTRELPDGLVVVGRGDGGLHGAAIASRGDHRVYMAHALLAPLVAGPLRIDHPECVAVSYPDFHEHLAAIHAAADRAG